MKIPDCCDFHILAFFGDSRPNFAVVVNTAFSADWINNGTRGRPWIFIFAKWILPNDTTLPRSKHIIVDSDNKLKITRANWRLAGNLGYFSIYPDSRFIVDSSVGVFAVGKTDLHYGSGFWSHFLHLSIGPNSLFAASRYLWTKRGQPELRDFPASSQNSAI